MANRYGDRNQGRREGRGSGGYRASFEGGGDRDRGDRSEYGREENYFGSGRQQYGGGYTGTGRTGRDNAEWTGNFGRGSDDYSRGDYSRGSSGRERGGYEGGSRQGDYDREDYGRGSYGGDPGISGGGMFGGGIGGYSGGGYQGYDQDENRGGWSGYGGGNYGRSEYGNYGGSADYNRPSRTYTGSYGRGGEAGQDYPESESGYRSRGQDRGGRGGRGEEGWWDRMSNEVSSWFGGEDDDRERRSHRGRGPRSYTRSDDRIKEDINDRLTDNEFLDASDIDVEVNNREVVLTGTVDSRYAKRLAEDIAEDVSGVNNVENRIRVNQERGQQLSNWGQGSFAGANTGTAGTTGVGTSEGSTGTTGTTGALGATGAAGSNTGTTGATDTGNTADASTTGKRGRSRAAGSGS